MSPKKAFLAAIILLALFAAGFFIYFAVRGAAGDPAVMEPPAPQSSEPSPPSVSPTLIYESTSPPSDTPPDVPDKVSRPEKLAAVYLPDVFDTQARMGALQLGRAGLINAVVLCVKDDDGALAFVSDTEIATAAGANREDGSDLESFIDELRASGLYVIARMAVFEENLVSNQYRGMSVATVNGTRWLDWRYHGWLNPYNADVRQYVKDLCAEVCALGVDEILLDSFRFPTRGRPELLYFADETVDGVARTDSLQQLAAEIKELLGERGVLMSIGCTSADLSQPVYASGMSAETLNTAGYAAVAADGATVGADSGLSVALRITLTADYSGGEAAAEIAEAVRPAASLGGYIVESAEGLYPAEW